MSKFVKPLASHLKTTLKHKFLMRSENGAKMSDNLFVFEGIGTMTTQEGNLTLGAVFRPKSMTYGSTTVIPASTMESHAKHDLDFGWLDTKSKVFKRALEQIAQEKKQIANGEKTFDQYPKLDDIYTAALSKQEISFHAGPFNYNRFHHSTTVYGEMSPPKNNPGNKPTP